MAIDRGTGLYFESFGAHNPTTILFLHGGGVGGWMWRKQIDAFKSDYHCLAPDLPEQGKNIPTSKSPFTMNEAAELIAALVCAQAHGGKAHVAGLSEGAQVTVAMLSRTPDVIDHALVSSAMLRPFWGNALTSPKAAGWMYRWFVAPFKNNDWWIRTNMHGNGMSDEYFEDFKANFQLITEASFVNLLKANSEFRLPEGLSSATLPVLVAVGSKEYKAMKQSSRDLVAALPHARGIVVSLGKGSSTIKEHGWAMTAPELFSATLRAWIENRPLPKELLPL